MATLRSALPALRPAAPRPALRPARTLFTQRRSPSRATQNLDLNRLNAKRRDYEQNRTAFLAAGAVAGILSFAYTAWKLNEALAAQRNAAAVRCDAPPSMPAETFKTEAGERRKVVVHDDEGRELVPTGSSVVPAFPRLMGVDVDGGASPSSPGEGVEFTLVGLGMRSVTFIGLQVYLVGFYVATQDIARLQRYLMRNINPLATTLIPAEREALRRALLDAAESEETWDALLREAGCRSALRIMPVRDTDFHHLRDGFVRAIQARSQRAADAYGDEAFGAAMKEFRAIFNRGQVPKKRELLLCRRADGALSVLYGDGKLESKDARRELLGTVSDERLSRLLWLNYLAGSKPASEGARTSIVHGVLEFVERPVGTVAAQVV